jgi:hypothetical protein
MSTAASVATALRRMAGVKSVLISAVTRAAVAGLGGGMPGLRLSSLSIELSRWAAYLHGGVRAVAAPRGRELSRTMRFGRLGFKRIHRTASRARARARILGEVRSNEARRTTAASAACTTYCRMPRRRWTQIRNYDAVMQPTFATDIVQMIIAAAAAAAAAAAVRSRIQLFAVPGDDFWRGRKRPCTRLAGEFARNGHCFFSKL